MTNESDTLRLLEPMEQSLREQLNNPYPYIRDDYTQGLDDGYKLGLQLGLKWIRRIKSHVQVQLDFHLENMEREHLLHKGV